MKGEGRSKRETNVSRIDFAEPPPILSKDSERRGQEQMGKRMFHELILPSRPPMFAHSAKIAKGEGRSKWGNECFMN